VLLAAALRAQSAGVFIAERRLGGKGLRIIFVNDGFCTLTGRAARDLIGCMHGELHDEPLELGELRAWLKQALPGQSLVGEVFLRRADGTTVSTAWSFDLVCDTRGKATHVVATYRDQTEKRRLQEALVHAQRLDAVGRLAGGVAHDFNNQLSVINGYCEMLAAHVAANPQALREVAEIHAAGRKATALTQQLLAFSRRQPFDLRVINLNALVRENAEILGRLLGDAGTIEFELASDLANVRTDPAQFQQVILNLVLNARDALRAGGRVTIATANRDVRGALHRRFTDKPPGRYVSVSVIDNGTGMDTETQKHLFEPFFTTKPEGKGTGLGLALVYGVVQQSGGFITVKSSLFVGSTFEILLPVERAPVETPTNTPAVPTLPATHGTETVLLAEPDELVRKMVAGILTADGYRVFAAKTIATAEIEAAGRIPQLVISEFTGLDEKSARELLATQPDLRVLRATNRQEAAPLPWLAPAQQQVITKPYALSELLKTVRRLLDA
jgi:PAS domain S-box-containing protein